MSNSRTERNLKLRKAIAGLFGLRLYNMAISFLLVPLYLFYIDETQLGVWFTIASFLAWFGLMDFGLSNGLRNKFAEAISHNKIDDARGYVSTSYALISIVSIVVLIVFLGVYPFVSWDSVFNQSSREIENIGILVLSVFSMLCVQFVAQIIKVILIADQKPQIAGGMNAIANTLTLIGLIALVLINTKGSGSILEIGIIISASNLIVPIVATLYYFSKKYRQFSPSIKHVSFKKYGSVMSLGIQFFIMQAAGLIVLTTDNMIITQAVENGTEDVTPYNVAYKYFSIMITMFMVITTPFWSAFTDAFAQKDIAWIKRITKRTMKFWAISCVLVIVMVLIAPWVYEIWVGIEVPSELNVLMAWWVIVNTGLQVFSHFLSGTGKIRLSLFHSILMIVLNIPLSIYFAKYLGMGSYGVLLASCICISLRLFQPIQFYKIISGNAKGIWNK